MRKAAQITGAAVVAAVLLSGCGKGGGSAKDATPTPATSDAPSASAAAAATAGGAKLDGTWQAKGPGGPTTLTIVGDKAAVAAGKTVCAGAVVTNGKAYLRLKCTDGSKQRAEGIAAPSPDGTSLSVNWNGTTETFSRTAKPVNLPGLDKLKQ